ncbi:MAG: gamma-glutamyltransferase [Longimicrobiales bacterium]|nr:gamma-glutamyltransferase [Longimicrobiales bacterium]
MLRSGLRTVAVALSSAVRSRRAGARRRADVLVHRSMAVAAPPPHRARARSALAVAAPLLAFAGLAQAQENGAVRTETGVVSSQQWVASQVGADVLAAGGNAVDAAIATGFALAVTHPTAGNIGGGGFMVIRFPDGRSTALDFREKAPLGAHPRMWLDEDGEYSYERHHRSHLAVGVPGTVAGFDKAHRLFGRADWSDLVQPAVELAGEGFELSEALAGSLGRFVERIEYQASIQAFSKNGRAYAPGEILRQPDLARTLARIRDERADGFYHGETAGLIAAEMRRGGGLITERDLALYRARERTPVTGTYRGYDVISMPPPSSGGVAIVTMLNILEAYDLVSMGHNSADYIHHLAEAMRRAFRERATHLADVDFADVPVHRLTSKEHAEWLRRDLDPERASVSHPADVLQRPESPETTHYSVVDADGLAVSVTYTLEQGYGSGIVVPGAGFLLNNEMGDFNAGPGLTDESGLIGTEPNLARPEQRMLSSMSPSILARDGELLAVIGSPGGRTIINTTLQLILNIVDFGMGIEEAVAAPRIHHQWLPDRIRIEDDGASLQTVQRLEDMGHRVQMRGRQGSANSIGVDRSTGELVGAPDPRSPDSGARASGGGP